MRFIKAILSLIILINILSCAKRPWQEFNDVGVDELAANFHSPPVEYSMTFYWGWDGEITAEVIARDLDAFKERGVHIVTLESGYDMGHPYLSEGWFEMVKKTVELAKERDMRVWIVDEGKYPSGFAGGKFTTDAPELRMKALVVAERLELKEGDLLSQTLDKEIVSAIAINEANNTNQILDVQSGKINWTVPEGDWQVLFIKHDFRSSPTRAVNNPTRGKDPSNSLMDYLDPAATQKFLEFTHEQHEKYVGSEFGKTVLGFRGDEPDYSIRGVPWTPEIFSRFEKIKGYDIQPYTASFFTKFPTDEQKRVRADYWDVWSDMFGDSFFKGQADWCDRHDLEYLVHLNKEDNMMALVAHEGDLFECMRHVQMPGVDAIWNQIWPNDEVTDFPKYASSASHVYGKPRTFTESFAAYKVRPTVAQAKWVLDHQLVRGINMVEVMFIPASTRGESGLSGWTASDSFPDVANYIHRMCYLLSQGRPATELAVYHPTTSLWLGDREANEDVLKLMQSLLEMQRDFDFIDEHALTSVLKIGHDGLMNPSGQSYRTVIVPSVTCISNAALDQLKAFVSNGGKVIFLGKEPSLIVQNTFKDASSEPVDLSWGIIESSGELTPNVLKAFPEPDVQFEISSPSVKYVHRKLKDADLYFFFNEGNEGHMSNVLLKGKGNAQVWNGITGRMQTIESLPQNNGYVKLNMEMAGWESKCILIGFE